MGNPEDGFQPLVQIEGGENQARGRFKLDTVTEGRPCFLCKSWEKDRNRLIRHLLAQKGTRMQPDGTFVSDIQETAGQKSIVVDPARFGFCRLNAWVTEDEATCERFAPSTRAEELARRIEKR